MRFGVNYTPRVGWFHHWVDFDPTEVDRDLQTIASLEVDHIRVFPLWPVFQPNPSYISPRAIDCLHSIIDLAAKNGLDVAVDGLQGHLSSFDFVPAWLTSWHQTNWFTDPQAVSSIVNFIATLAKASAEHTNVFAFTVGNEVNQFTGGVHPHPLPATTLEIGTWLETILQTIRHNAPNLMAVHACYDASWFDNRQPFTLEHVAQLGDATVAHSWIFNGTAELYGSSSFETNALARYLLEVARAFQADPQRPLWLQEAGAPLNMLSKNEVPNFMEQTFHHLTCAPNLFGITWWSSHDVSRSLSNYPELEYDLGLIDEYGKVKDEGKLLRKLILENKRVQPVAPQTQLVLNPDSSLGRQELAPGGAFFNRYMELAQQQGHPHIVLHSSTTNTSLEK